jgi:hypothetical protein
MSRPLVPELHDIGKLYFVHEDLADEWKLTNHSLHNPENMRSLPSRLGLPEPATRSWQGVIEHHRGREARSPQDLELLLLMVADHAASSVSREHSEQTKSDGKATYRSVYKLWNPAEQQELVLPGSRDELSSLIQWLSTDPDRDQLFCRYAYLLDLRPEDLLPPKNATSLASHLTLVGKIYRFLHNRQDFYVAKKLSVEDTENKPVGLIKAEVTFPQKIVRTRDMSLFALMSEKIQNLAQDDRILLATFDQLLAILSPEEKIEDLFGPLVDAGFRVAWERAETKVNKLEATPLSFRQEWLRHLEQELAKIPENHRGNVRAKRLAAYPRGILFGPLTERFAPPICDLCQMEAASVSWPDDPQVPGPRENLGPRCHSLRQHAARMFKLDRWTEQQARVAWIYIGLDLDQLDAFLRPLYQKHAMDAGWPPEEARLLRVRPSLLIEFQKDYHRFLAEFAGAVQEYFKPDNLERVVDGDTNAANALLCVRLESVSQLSTLLNSYLEGVRHHFPVMLSRTLGIDTVPQAPMRLAVSVSSVKFPFSEHWRIMQEEKADVLLNVMGKGQVRIPLASLPILVETSKPSHRTALHNLIEVAKVSDALARVYMGDKENYSHYRPLLEQMRPFGMTYDNLLTYAKILGD